MTKNICRVLLLLSLLLLSPSCYSADTTTTEPQQTVTMQLSQYNRLKTIINQQEMTLATLETKLAVLSSNSTEQEAILTQLQDELMSCKNELDKTRQSLTSANISLIKAEETLQRQAESLKTLTQQIKQLVHKQAVLRRQRDTWRALTIGIVGYIAYDKLK